MSKELIVQSQFAQYVSLQYPYLLCHADANGKQAPVVKVQRKNGRMAQYAPQAVKMKKAGAKRGFPDWFCYRSKAEQMLVEGVKEMQLYHGLALEFKAPGVYPFLKRGEVGLRKDVHLAEQYEVLNKLRKEGYAAYFIYGKSLDEIFNRAKWTLDTYIRTNGRVKAIDEFWREQRAVYKDIAPLSMKC